MSSAALGYQRALRYCGVLGEVFADEIADGYDGVVQPAASLAPNREDVVLYHHGIASKWVARLLHLPCKRGVVFHNITPSRFYEGTRLSSALQTARAQLSALASHVSVSIAVSRFNAQELISAGHQNVHVVPLLLEPRRFELDAADPALLRRLRSGGSPRILSVSRVVPHKRIDDLITLHQELRRLSPSAVLRVVGGFDAGSPYFQALLRRARAVGGVEFLGRLSHTQLVAAYRSADLYLSMSEHEGLGVPLLEAFASDVPVMAFGAAAVPETMDGRGIVFDEKHFAALAELVSLVLSDAAQRRRLIEGQRERLKDFSLEAVAQALFEALQLKRPTITTRSSQKPRLALVVQRFGETILGGAETHARQVAMKLADHAAVEVFTTCAVDHLSWKNELPPGRSIDGPLVVHRFPSQRVRNVHGFNHLSKEILGRSQDVFGECRWLTHQGPVVPTLFEHLLEDEHRFDAVSFFTYLYQPTVYGVPLLRHKALVVPTAHDEPPLAFEIMGDVFETPRWLLFNTPEEQSLVEARFPRHAPSRVVGVGIDALPSRPDRFRSQFRVDSPFLLYLGRMEEGKGVAQLVAFHQQLVRQFHDAPGLVLAGAGPFRPRGKNLFVLGRIDEQAKWDALAAALAVVAPSQFESLSLVALEAFTAGTPVLGNLESQVLKGHLDRSRAGVGYTDAASFAEAVRRAGAERATLAKAATRYARQYQWSTVTDAWLTAIDAVRRANA
jgi:glycosyltransferase involved in cell wall biosynthesis